MDIILYVLIVILILSNTILAVVFIREKSLDKRDSRQTNYTFMFEDKEVTIRLTPLQYNAIISLIALFKYEHDIDILKEKSIKNIE